MKEIMKSIIPIEFLEWQQTIPSRAILSAQKIFPAIKLADFY